MPVERTHYTEEERKCLNRFIFKGEGMERALIIAIKHDKTNSVMMLRAAVEAYPKDRLCNISHAEKTENAFENIFNSDTECRKAYESFKCSFPYLGYPLICREQGKILSPDDYAFFVSTKIPSFINEIADHELKELVEKMDGCCKKLIDFFFDKKEI